ncbi:MAG: hypothetical protein HQL50_06305 [Magnetococcales bacterium]|nr:hypothetical protein [Magnetococcales bacterium]
MRNDCCPEENTVHGDNSPGTVADTEIVSRFVYSPSDIDNPDDPRTVKNSFIKTDELLPKDTTHLSCNRETHLDRDSARIQSHCRKPQLAVWKARVAVEKLRKTKITHPTPGIPDAHVCVIDDPTDLTDCENNDIQHMNRAHALIYLDGEDVKSGHAKKLRTMLYKGIRGEDPLLTFEAV